MNRKRTFVILGVIVLLFLGIFTFAQESNEKDPKKNDSDGSGQVIDDPTKIEEEKPEEIISNVIPRRTTITPDTIAPVIVLNGEDTIYIDINSTYEEKGAIITDNRDSDKIATINGVVNTNKAGKYTLTYSGIDAAGNVAIEVIRTVYVRPLITATSTLDTYEAGDPTLPVINATVLYDNEVGEQNITPDVAFDPTLLGTQIIKFNYNYEGVDSEEKTIAIIVQDTTAPSDLMVTLNVEGNVDEYIGNWTNKKIIATLSAIDNGTGIKKFQYSFDNGITWNDGQELLPGVSTATIEFNAEMEENIIFRAVDRVELYSNVSEPKEILIDKTFPIITMNGDAIKTITRNFNLWPWGFTIDYAEEGYTYVENNFASESTTIKYIKPYSTTEELVNKVDVNVGTYKINYTITDLAGNSTTEVRTVYVIKAIYEIKGLEIFVGKTKLNVCTSLECPNIFTAADFNAIAMDWWNGELGYTLINVDVSTNINIRVLGKYSATFTATDWKGKTITNTVEIDVIDKEKPQLIATGSNVNRTIQGVSVEIPEYIAQDNYDTDVAVTEKYNYYEHRYTKNVKERVCLLWKCWEVDVPKLYTDTYLTSVTYTAIDDSYNDASLTYDISPDIIVNTKEGWF